MRCKLFSKDQILTWRFAFGKKHTEETIQNRIYKTTVLTIWELVICVRASMSAQDPHMFPFFSSSDCSQLPSQSSRLSHSHCLRTAPCWEKRRMHHLLRPGGGHSHLHLRTHVSVQRLRPEAEETDQRMLSNMQEAHQRCYQNISAMMVQMFKQVLWLPLLDATCGPFSGLVGRGSWPQLEISHTRTYCAYICVLYGWMISIQRLCPSYSGLWRGPS